MTPARRLRSIALAAGLLAAAAAPLRAQQSGPQEVTMAVPAFSLTFSLGYIADDLRLWQKNGLKVKSVLIAGVGAVNSVIAGSAQFAQSSPTTLTRAAAHGQRLLAIAEMLDRLVVEVVLRKDLAEAGGFDPKAPLAKRALLLRGRTIAVESINSVIHAYVRVLAKRAGFDPEEVRVAPIQPPNMIAAFETRQIDGFAMSLPWPLQPALAGTGVIIASGPDGDPPDMVPFGHILLVTRRETCEKRSVSLPGHGPVPGGSGRFHPGSSGRGAGHAGEAVPDA